MENVLEMLKREAEKENKCKAQAILLLEQITEEIAEPLEEILGGDEYDHDVPEGYIWVHRGLYYRYIEHSGEINSEKIGFYCTNDGLPAWGTPLEELKGRFFWEYILYVCEWVENTLPTLVEQHSEYREGSFSYLKKIAEAIEAAKIEEKNRSE